MVLSKISRDGWNRIDKIHEWYRIAKGYQIIQGKNAEEETLLGILEHVKTKQGLKKDEKQSLKYDDFWDQLDKVLEILFDQGILKKTKGIKRCLDENVEEGYSIISTAFLKHMVHMGLIPTPIIEF